MRLGVMDADGGGGKHRARGHGGGGGVIFRIEIEHHIAVCQSHGGCIELRSRHRNGLGLGVMYPYPYPSGATGVIDNVGKTGFRYKIEAHRDGAGNRGIAAGQGDLERCYRARVTWLVCASEAAACDLWQGNGLIVGGCRYLTGAIDNGTLEINGTRRGGGGIHAYNSCDRGD